MSKSGYLRLLILSLVAALVFGLASLLALGWLSHSMSARHRMDFLLFVADSVERTLNDLGPAGLTDPASAAKIHEALSTRRGPPPRDHRPPRHDIWLFDAHGEQVYFEGENSARIEFDKLIKPSGPHEVTVSDGFFGLGPETNVIKLDHDPVLYLVWRDEHRPSLGPLFLTQAVITVSTLLIALFVSLSITFYYLRRKSSEARSVLKRLEEGDLKARFDIRPFDEFGGLLLDFNRMAGAIERLVDRVHTTEGARKNLLQELGHDIRTPLTSLTTSFETVRSHFAKMSDAQRNEIFEMMGAEIAYVRELVENLMTIASLHEPNYKTATECVNLRELLAQEADQRRLSAGQLKWDFQGEDVMVRGDAHLIQRMYRNALDNASRFARETVTVKLEREGGFAIATIHDDGPGLNSEALESFGKRQEKRTTRSDRGLGFSLGLGSVIMKAIAELHSGTVEVRNNSGAQIIIRLPSDEQQ